MNEFLNRLENMVRAALSDIGIDDEVQLLTPPDRKMGDYSISSAMKYAKVFKKSPMSIAQDIKGAIEKRSLDDDCGIGRIETAVPGYVNLFISDRCAIGMALDIARSPADFFRFKHDKPRKILLEFVSANPTGPLSIAHGRQAIVGDVMADILEFYGCTVQREYYVNDEGRQITLFAESVAQRMHELNGKECVIPQGGYEGEYLKDTARDLLAQNVDPDNLDAVREKAVAWNLENIRKTLSSAGIEYDSWISQRRLQDEGGIQKAVDFLTEHGYTFEEEGAVWFESTKFGDDKDRVLVRSSGVFTYFAADVAYHLYKLERGFDTLIDLWGPDHHGYIKRVESALESFSAGYHDYDFKVIIIQLVKLKNQKMSKRKGTMILLDDLISAVGRDAVRFYYILRRNSSHLDFDVELATAKRSDNPLFYVQYAHARIASVLERAGGCAAVSSLNDLSSEGEFMMIKKLLDFHMAVRLAAQQREPYVIADYLRSLAADFHKFYESHRIIDDENKNTTQARLALISLIKDVLKVGLDLLGVDAPLKM